MQSQQADRGVVGRQSTADEPRRSAQEWLLSRVKVMPNLLNQSPPWVRGVFDHAWAPREALARQVGCLPPELWGHLLGCDSGFIAIRTGESRYSPQQETIRKRQVQNVAFVSVVDLARDSMRPLHVIGHLIDHHLGCGGADDDLWLSEGGGMMPRWQQAGKRLSGLFALGYAVDEVAKTDVRNYFAQSLAHYCRDRQSLNVADPQVSKWLRSTLWNKAFWPVESSSQQGSEDKHG
jgi:hypothetical protein